MTTTITVFHTILRTQKVVRFFDFSIESKLELKLEYGDLRGANFVKGG